MEFLYGKIGKKIKAWAVWIFVIEAIGAVIAGIALMLNENPGAGLIIFICGPVVALVSTWLLYGFGEIIDKLCEIARNTSGRPSDVEKSDAQLKVENERLKKIQKLRAKGLISEEEYQQAISKED